MSDDLARLERRAARERAARKEAERLLESKTTEVFESNQALRAVQQELEQRVEQRTNELSAALQVAEQANASQRRFLAHVSHEFRTPLTSILGYTADLLEQQPDSADLVTVQRNAQHLLALINEVLDLARAEADTVSVDMDATDLQGLLQDLQRTFEPQAEAKGITFRLSIDPDVPAYVRADALRIRQILLNFVSNALKFTERGGVGLRVFRPADSDLLRFDVLDTGRGIPPDKVHAVFDPFHQIEEDDRGKGTGLGLAISKQLAEAMGGSVSVQSGVGRGSCFSLTLPLASSETAVVEAPVAPTCSLEGLHLLLAEDAPDSRALIERWCVRAGATVTAVANGVEAVRHAPGHDLVLMDIQMPVMNGLDATRALRQGGFQGPILALTAQTLAVDRIEMENAGCTDHLAKPVQRNLLIAQIRAHVDQAKP